MKNGTVFKRPKESTSLSLKVERKEPNRSASWITTISQDQYEKNSGIIALKFVPVSWEAQFGCGFIIGKQFFITEEETLTSKDFLHIFQ